MYQRQLDLILQKIEEEGSKPTLLLHVCCAPCSSYVLEYLIPYFSVTVDYYNPNIAPRAEYEKRLAELKRLIDTMPGASGIRVLSSGFDHDVFLDAVRGLEEEPEGGRRCAVCFEQRLREAADRAAAGGFDYYTTTLSISPHKNAAMLNEIGQREGARAGVAYLPSDFKKRGGYQRSIELSGVYDLYRQNYCGCEFSRAESERRQKGTN